MSKLTFEQIENMTEDTRYCFDTTKFTITLYRDESCVGYIVKRFYHTGPDIHNKVYKFRNAQSAYNFWNLSVDVHSAEV